jgi:hypothetical protein
MKWDEINSGCFENMIAQRGKRIRAKAEALFGISEEDFKKLFAETKPGE